MNDTLLQLLVVLIVCGLIWWVVSALPIKEPFKTPAQIVVAVIAIVWLLSFVWGRGPGHHLFSQLERVTEAHA